MRRYRTDELSIGRLSCIGMEAAGKIERDLYVDGDLEWNAQPEIVASTSELIATITDLVDELLAQRPL